MANLSTYKSNIPSGTIKSFAGSTTPSGWLTCDGSAVSRDQYANLFNKIGTNYGSGDGSTTFNLPDLRGRCAVGEGQGGSLSNRSLGEVGGEEEHTLLTDELFAHDHGYTRYGGFQSLQGGTSYPNTNYGSSSQSTIGAGSDQAHENMQPYLALRFIIKI